MASSIPLFEEVVSRDVLGFSFGGRSYADQITDAVAKTKVLCAVKVERKTIGKAGSSETAEVVWVTHNFGFLGAWSPRMSALLWSCACGLVSTAIRMMHTAQLPQNSSRSSIDCVTG